MALKAMMPYGDGVLRLYAKALYCKGKKVVTAASNFDCHHSAGLEEAEVRNAWSASSWMVSISSLYRGEK
jgi:hypothetical protein